MGVAGKAWNSPNTIIGLAWGGVGYASSQAGVAAGLTPPCNVTLGNNAIQFSPHPLMATAITLGNTISYRGGDYSPHAPDVAGEERLHTLQGEILGPAYLPAHLAGGMLSLVISGNWHDGNFMEQGPMNGRVF